MSVLPAAAAAGASISPVALFLQADIVVKTVMIGLLAASIWTWSIIIGHVLRMRRLGGANERFEQDFWKAEDIDTYYTAHRASELPSARVFLAGVQEWRRSTKGPAVDRTGTRARLASIMGSAADAEMDRLSDKLNILATTGAVAPFVGLFGTVWGIMRAFTDIAAQENSSLAVVAPGIAEALFATALGLFAAIPAVIAYNRLTHGLNRLEARLHRFADAFHATLSRELEAE
ncbi:protein TolQ [Sphingomonas quercus]|uniref:Protein TolQ n=1 Tax=Sphingomonas quercus TaxID=2842451 RepID=A0ABS6BEY8_9SPHN|nr:protein TolQ [Sphingomonas quercus]MBU3076865.1 protein TolQ [Sphingomonas quercus]